MKCKGFFQWTSFICRWLRSVAGIVSEEMDPDNPQVTKIVAVLTDQELAVYNRNFGKS